MNSKIGGQRPRPRVALLGSFDEKDIIHFKCIFPTLWTGNYFDDLRGQVDVREIDLLIVAADVEYAGDWPEHTHVICFSANLGGLPGPVSHSFIEIQDAAETEEFLFPNVPLPISRRREADYGTLTSVRGWARIRLDFTYELRQCLVSPGKRKTATNIFNCGTIICESQTKIPLAVYFLREGSQLGVCWLPSVGTNTADWVEVIVSQWGQLDKDGLSSIKDWTSSPEWMVVEEMQILSQIQDLEQKRKQSVIEINKQIGELSTKLALLKVKADSSQRRLITAQGPELVEEVALTLERIGFNVIFVDELIGKKEPKREDLRLKHVDKGGEEWNAIVEVRGYARSGGTTADLLRLARFTNLYEKEIGRKPSKLIYIVNGQLELLPSQRQEPLVSAPEDLEIFAESNGVLIWSIDLFRAIKVTDPQDYPLFLESIKLCQGRWVPSLNPK